MQDRRKEAYEIIQDLGTEFKVAIRRQFGKSYTQVSTEELWNYIDEHTEERIDAVHPELVEWIYDFVKKAAKTNILDPDDVVVLADLLTELGARFNEKRMF